MNILIGVYLGLSAIFFFWLGRTVWTLRNTVQAQSSTINALSTLIDSMKAVQESTDVKAMLKRVKDYEEFVDLEKEAHIKRARQEKEKAIEKLAGATSTAVDIIIKDWRESLSKSLGLVSRMMPYLSPDGRDDLIGSLDYGEQEWIKEIATEIAAAAPYISPDRTKEFWQGVVFPPPSLPKKD